MALSHSQFLVCFPFLDFRLFLTPWGLSLFCVVVLVSLKDFDPRGYRVLSPGRRDRVRPLTRAPLALDRSLEIYLFPFIGF